jgi:hypothetical protein
MTGSFLVDPSSIGGPVARRGWLVPSLAWIQILVTPRGTASAWKPYG